MSNRLNPDDYEAWYHAPRGAWAGDIEFSVLHQLMQPKPEQTLLDVGCGTGYFSRRFANVGLEVTGVDPDPAMLSFARNQSSEMNFLEGTALQLPFEDESFDYCTAITSLCFVDEPAKALAEMWRVSRRGVALGLLNRHSLLYRHKHDRDDYKGARWDDWIEVTKWRSNLEPLPVSAVHRTAIFFLTSGVFGRYAEYVLPGILPWGGFLATYLRKHS